jgi:hypothetical protein
MVSLFTQSGMSNSESNETKYARIWEAIYPCVDKCLLCQFKNVQEMLHCNRWCIVHVSCRNIITRHMAALGIQDPHDFDKAVCWKVVKEGWDTDPKWRCICAFFLAAAMELDMVKRHEENQFKRVRIHRVDTFHGGEYTGSDPHKEFLELVKQIEKMYNETHKKMSEMHQKLVGIHSPNVHVHVLHHTNSDSPLDVNVLFNKVIDIMKSSKGRVSADSVDIAAANPIPTAPSYNPSAYPGTFAQYFSKNAKSLPVRRSSENSLWN